MSRYDELLALPFPERRVRYDRRDTILYALGVGAGADPDELRFVRSEGLQALPSMAVVLGSASNWYRDLPSGLDDVRTVHASERFELFAPLPPEGEVVATTRVTDIFDKGPSKGALVVTERTLIDAATGALLAKVRDTGFCRGDGGLGGPIVPAPPPHELPQRPPDAVLEMPTSPRAALVYRLSGDSNPLHVDAAFAAAAGFDGPILHGLSTHGHVARAILRFAGADATIRMMDCRFVAPVYPGETLAVALWRDGATVSFRAAAAGRLAVDRGVAEVA